VDGACRFCNQTRRCTCGSCCTFIGACLGSAQHGCLVAAAGSVGQQQGQFGLCDFPGPLMQQIRLPLDCVSPLYTSECWVVQLSFPSLEGFTGQGLVMCILLPQARKCLPGSSVATCSCACWNAAAGLFCWHQHNNKPSSIVPVSVLCGAALDQLLGILFFLCCADYALTPVSWLQEPGCRHAVTLRVTLLDARVADALTCGVCKSLLRTARYIIAVDSQIHRYSVVCSQIQGMLCLG
jgi:hypothetical protein